MLRDDQLSSARVRFENFGDWTDRIAKPASSRSRKPPRPQGVERNVVITEWDWRPPTTYLHDEISTDKRNPTLNAYGKIYGSPEESSDYIPVLDPVHNSDDVGSRSHGARSGHADVRRLALEQAVDALGVLGRPSASGRARRSSTTRCSTSTAGCG